MKQLMIDMMAKMMPFMKPIAGVGALLAVVALVMALTGRSARGGLASFAVSGALAVGFFFVACEVAGRALGMEPTLLFGSDPFDRAMYRNQWPFWSIGLGLVALAAVARSMAGRKDRA